MTDQEEHVERCRFCGRQWTHRGEYFTQTKLAKPYSFVVTTPEGIAHRCGTIKEDK